MEYRRKADLEIQSLPGRGIQKCIGKDGPIVSGKMTVGFARYSDEFGPMEPHHHAEETVLILAAEKGRTRYGGEPDALEHSLDLEAGMLLHFPELEWHVFEYDPGGYVEIAFIYGQVDKIRPEEME